MLYKLKKCLKPKTFIIFFDFVVCVLIDIISYSMIFDRNTQLCILGGRSIARFGYPSLQYRNTTCRIDIKYVFKVIIYLKSQKV